MSRLNLFASFCGRRVARQSTLLCFKPKYLFNSALCHERRFRSTEVKPEAKVAAITFKDRDGDVRTVLAKHGDTLLDVAKNNDIDLEGACEGTLSCSTCHLIFDPEEFARIGLPPPSEDELDMLDFTYGVTPTWFYLSKQRPVYTGDFRCDFSHVERCERVDNWSRLGCQIEVNKKFDGISLKVPEATRDAREK